MAVNSKTTLNHETEHLTQESKNRLKDGEVYKRQTESLITNEKATGNE